MPIVFSICGQRDVCLLPFLISRSPIVFKNRLRSSVRCQLIPRKPEGSAFWPPVRPNLEISYPNYYHLVTVLGRGNKELAFLSWKKTIILVLSCRNWRHLFAAKSSDYGLSNETTMFRQVLQLSANEAKMRPRTSPFFFRTLAYILLLIRMS